jgi:ubiquinone/menaquinone biosynthesis C-methylase UbiE
MTSEIDYQDYQQALQFEQRITSSTALQSLASLLIELLNPQETQKVLDVGTGTGRLGMMLSHRIPKGAIVGIDSGYGMLKVAREKVSASAINNFFLVRGRAENLPFRPQSFDSACLMLSFHHFSNPERALLEIYQVLKSEGQLVSLDPVLKEPLDEEERRLNESIEEDFQLAHGPQFRFFTAGELPQLYERAGFYIASRQTHHFPFQQRGIEGIPMGVHWLQAYESLRFRKEKDLIAKFRKNYFTFAEKEGQLVVKGEMSWLAIKATKR